MGYRHEYETFKDELREAFLESFDGIAMEDEDGASIRNPEYEEPQYWQDEISELADRAVPIFPDSMYELWMGLGRPNVDDPGLTDGVTDIDKIVAMALYEQASQALYEIAEEYDLF